MDKKLTIIIRQYSAATRAHRYAEQIKDEVDRRWGGKIKIAVNQLDTNVIQVELIGSLVDFEKNGYIDLTF